MDHGYDAFALTVDTDSYSRRERDIAKRHQRRRVRVDDAARWNVQRIAEPQYHASPAVLQRSIGFVDEGTGSRLAHAPG